MLSLPKIPGINHWTDENTCCKKNIVQWVSDFYLVLTRHFFLINKNQQINT